MKPMDFQAAAADRILELFRKKGQNRVLLADEVGLGKTIIASRVVTSLAEEHRNARKKFKVVYVCSNLNIASQNCRKLGIPDEDCMRFSESRLSLQHLRLREIDSRPQQLIPMTPATSFSIKWGQGIQEERALIYVVLSQHPIYRGYKGRLSRLLKFDPSLKNWEGQVKGMKKRVKRVSDKDSRYLPRLFKAFDKFLRQDKDLKDNLNYLCDRKYPENEDYRLRAAVVNGLRRVFAQISLISLHPDLVIMDEFQRFKDLLDTGAEEDSEQSLLSRQFLNDEKTRVLLLSATPYRPFSTLEEFSKGEEDHYTEFKRVLDFLCNDEIGRRKFERIWSDYSAHLNDLHGENVNSLIEVKKDAEKAMYQVICRTERRNEGIIDTQKACSVKNLLTGDVTSYIDIQRLMDALELGKFPIEYEKSAPYLMSFMKYKVWESLVNAVRNNPGVPELNKDTLFLKKKQINNYLQIPCNNSRLETLFSEAFGAGRNGAECLLWIPASKPYYNAERTKVGRIYANNVGYSKILVFSSWEMVPRVISGLTSYEAERLVCKRLPDKKKMHYFAEDTGDDRRARRKGAHQRISDDQGNLQLCITPCKALADLYHPVKHLGSSINSIRDEVKQGVKELLKGIREQGYTRNVPRSADNIVCLLHMLDGIDTGAFKGIPNGIEDFLTDLAIGSPANCALRLFSMEEASYSYAEKVARAFVSLFNKPESAGILRTLYGENSVYYEQVMRYCVEGNLQAVLDEYAFVLSEKGERLADAIKEGFVSTASIQVDTKETVKGQLGQNIRLRTHFAVGYYNAKISEQAVQRTENIRKAFNSPFRPFVLATTSIGQEGLDFHYYARKIMHWNLPSNPIDLEQREGRINRYLCHAIRQNLAESKYGSKGFNEDQPVWETILNNARELKGNNSDLVPFWCLPDNFPYTRKIERIVPMYPFSNDMARYERLIDILAIYRLTLGQPRQEELIDSIRNEKLEKEQLEKLYMNLSPWERSHKCI
ncbi:MAG: DEAD/DEAH box helicase [Lachnospiraceae bacterium]|nr:DEAD/DEAH box helicase [Lachnospiraceae bacterium]